MKLSTHDNQSLGVHYNRKIYTLRSAAEWKKFMADSGRRRYLCYTTDFDARAFFLSLSCEGYSDEEKSNMLNNKEKIKSGLIGEFGEFYSEEKINNFIDIGTKPFSIISYHNQFFDEVRRSFVIGAYYPALVGACALGERILNHLILDMRDFHKTTPEYKKIYRKSSFDNWKVPIDTLESWNVLLPKVVEEFRLLMDIRHRSIHFNVGTYATLRKDALSAIHHIRNIIEQQFAAFGDRPWFIKGTCGHVFIKRDWEDNPFIKVYYLPTCPFVGPYFSICLKKGVRFFDHQDYGDGEWSDEEFASRYEARLPEQLAKVVDISPS